MNFGNNFEVTIGHNPSFSPISKKTIELMDFLTLFFVCVTETCSQRNKLLLRKEDGLFPVIVDNSGYTKLWATVFTGFSVCYLQNQFPNQFLVCKIKTAVRFSFWKLRAVSDSGFQMESRNTFGILRHMQVYARLLTTQRRGSQILMKHFEDRSFHLSKEEKAAWNNRQKTSISFRG